MQNNHILLNRSYGQVFSLKVKVKLSLYRPWRPLGLREVEAPTFPDIQFTDGGKVVCPTLRQLLPSGRFLVLTYVID
jgi:hypothetical protein